MRSDDRPGLMLICHGDLPDTLLADPECSRLYGECMEACEQTAWESSAYRRSPLSGLSQHIASFLSSESDGPVEVAYLGFRRPGLREALYRVVASGSRSVVCVGGAGLMLPGHGASVHLPAAVGEVVASNGGLDVCRALPGINPHVTSALVLASVESALNGFGLNGRRRSGRCIPPRPAWEAPRIGGDTGVLVASAPDHTEALRTHGLGQIQRLDAMARALAGPARTSQYMAAVAGDLEASGAFCAVRPGYVDFASPGLEAAAAQLVKTGARQIIAAGLPLLMSRHALSWADPSDAVHRLKESCAADIVYLLPDPALFAQEIAAMLRMSVLEAAAMGR